MMSHMAVLALIAVIWLGALTYLCIPSSRWRIVATAVYASLAAGIFGLGIETMGTVKPLALEWRQVVGLPIVGIAVNEPERRVYIWAMRGSEPVAYAIPWPAGGADAVADIIGRWSDREQTGEAFFMTDNADDVADVEAPPALPPKDETQ